MLEAFSGFLSALKQTSPAVFLGLAIATGLILFSSDSFVATLGLENFRNETKGYLGAVFVVSLSIPLAQVVLYTGTFIKERYKKYRDEQKNKIAWEKKKGQLHSLTPDEKAYLSPYILNDENTQYFLIEDGVVGSLLAKDIIYQASQIGSIVSGWAFNIQPWARDYLKEHTHLLEGANQNPQGPPRW
ncbi:MAG: superinfection exclusion B family protein [Planctomycetota bacterium]|jgi:hypothetical protein